jgi:ABC-type sugar transport system substrate-binding protein
MNMIFKLILGLTALALFVVSPAWGSTKKIAIFTTRDEGDMFWQPVVDFASMAANQFDYEIVPYFCHGNHFAMKDLVKDAAAKKVDAMILVNFKRQLVSVAEEAEKAGIPFLVINSGFDASDAPGEPRGKMKHWIGEMLPDDEGAGYELAKILTKKAKAAKDGKVHIIGLEGIISDQASIERVKGLNRFVSQNAGKVVLDQVTQANWDPKTAQEKFEALHGRFPDAAVVWTASDGMGIAVGTKLKELGLAGKIHTGGVDWSNEGVQAVKDGVIDATIGGHYMEGGWAVIMMYDYFNGIDFKSEGLKRKSAMAALTKDKMAAYSAKLGSKEQWKQIDFKRFSKKANGVAKYDFTLKNLLK